MFFFDRAFRSFFLGASIFAVVSMLLWFVNYPAPIFTFSVDVTLWHAHEMVFGYALATVTGFLLTAAMNWTGWQTASGKLLAVVFFAWLLARIGFIVDAPIVWIAMADSVFVLGVFLHFFIPVFRLKHWQQMGLAVKFLLLVVVNGFFYAGVIWEWQLMGQAVSHLAIIAGLFLVLSINLTMIRRLLPFFTEKALGLSAEHIKNNQYLDGIGLVGFLLLMIAALFFPTHWATALIAFPLALANVMRLYNWYHQGIWKVVLLWPLHVSFGFMTLGMALYGFVGLGWVAETLAVHALAAGGIGLLCSAIMARISLGHTNRNVFSPPKTVVWVFVLLAITAVVRVLLPIVLPEYYMWWIHISQWGWALAFLWLSILYWPILTKPNPPKSGGLNL